VKSVPLYTDWLLVRRLADELDARFRGARVRDAGRLDDGRFALALWSKGRTELLCFDPFAPTPLITVEPGELGVSKEPRFDRAVVTALRGTVLTSVAAQTGERFIRFGFASRSRFGVTEEMGLLCELVPRFGNLVLLKGETIVAAAKEFGAAENRARTIAAGSAYRPPPARRGNATPLLSAEAAAALADEPHNRQPLHVYRRDGAIEQAHLLPLPKFTDLEHEMKPSLLEVFAEVRAGRSSASDADRAAKRRRDLDRKLRARNEKIARDLSETEEQLREAGERERLRDEAQAIYANLHTLADRERTAAKERAAALFSRYKKSGTRLEHLTRRQRDLSAQIEELAQLRWELERVSDADLEDVAQAADIPSAPRARKRKPLQYETAAGSRISVGRTPIENAELTFRVARPDDLWFHVRGAPGAHVILQRDDRSDPPKTDILSAAALAALHSKARFSSAATVDYTPRKHVRKRPAAAPGLVTYRNARSVRVAPAEPDLRRDQTAVQAKESP